MLLFHPADAALQDEVQKHRRTDGGHDDADRQLCRLYDKARDDIGGQQERGAEQRAAGKHGPVIGAGEQPHQVRDDDADEADDAGDGHRRADRGGR